MSRIARNVSQSPFCTPIHTGNCIDHPGLEMGRQGAVIPLVDHHITAAFVGQDILGEVAVKSAGMGLVERGNPGAGVGGKGRCNSGVRNVRPSKHGISS